MSRLCNANEDGDKYMQNSVSKFLRKISLGRSRIRCEYSIKMTFRKIWSEGIHWVHHMGRYRTLINTKISLRVS